MANLVEPPGGRGGGDGGGLWRGTDGGASQEECDEFLAEFQRIADELGDRWRRSWSSPERVER